METYGVRALASGTLVWVDEAGRAEVAGCSWLVEVPTGCPEPDFPSDLYRIEECGARLRAFDAADPEGGHTCEAGHDRWPYGSAGWAADDDAHEAAERASN